MISECLPLSALSIHDTDVLCQHYLNLIYRDTGGLGLLDNANKNNVAETYGEILFPGVRKLLALGKLTERDTFYDLGSGLGKIVLQVFLQTQVRLACGIEIIPALHARAAAVAARLQRELPEFFAHARKLNFLEGSFLELPIDNATVVLTGSPCFPLSLLAALAEKIDNTPSVHTVFSLRPLLNLTRLKFKRTLRVECSWDAALCYVYMS